LRTIIFVAAALLLSGCETEEGWVPGESHVSERPQLAAHIASAPSIVTTTAPASVVAPPPPAPVTEAPPPPAETQAPQIAAAPVPNAVDAHCQAVAHQRAADAHANGFSFKMADVIYEGTYKDCVAWDAQHGAGPVQ
jgi:hypothetical protein